MPLTLMARLPARVIQVLKDYLPAELDLVDANVGDGIVTPDIDTSRGYFELDKRVLDVIPSLCIHTLSSEPVEVKPITFGSRAYAIHNLEILVTVSSQLGDALLMEKLLHRYAAAIIRVLCIQKLNLETAADPVPFAEIVQWLGTIDYRPLPEQQDGKIVRTVSIPIAVRLREVRS
jgi:hypothetical protein